MTNLRSARVLCYLCLGIACGGGGSSNGTPTTPSSATTTTITTTTTTIPATSPTPGANPAVMGTMTARVDGTSFSAVGLAHAVLDDKSAAPLVIIQGWGPSPRLEPQIYLSLRPRIGTVNLSAADLTNPAMAMIAVNTPAVTVYSANQIAQGSSGSVTITALRPRVVGTFEFVGVRDDLGNGRGGGPAKRVTEGRFDIQACDPPCSFDPIK